MKELHLKSDININTAPHIICALYVLSARNIPIGSRLLDEALRDYPEYFEKIETENANH